MGYNPNLKSTLTTAKCGAERILNQLQKIILKKMKKVRKQSKNNQESNTPLVGWICPRCGKGLSPFASSCDCIYKLKPLKKEENPFSQDKFLPDYTYPQEIPYYNTPTTISINV